MKILHCISSLGFGGVETIVPKSISILQKLNPKNKHILCAFRTGTAADHIISLLSSTQSSLRLLDKKKHIDIRFCKDFIGLTKELKPDIIHAYNPTPMLWSRFLLWKNKSFRIIGHCGGIRNVTGLRGRLIEKFLNKRTDYFIFNSKSTQKIWNHYITIKCPQKVIYNGIDLKTYESKNKDNKKKGNKPFIILIVSRLTPQKALHISLKAIKIIKEKGIYDIRLEIVGEGPSTNNLKQLATSLGVDDMVRFEGYKTNVQPYYENSHIAVCTSYNETFSLFLAEAMYNRLVCISANVGGPSEIIQDGVNGFLLPPIENVIKENRKLCTSVVYNGHFDKIMQPSEVSPLALTEKIIEVKKRYEQLQHIRKNARQTIAMKFSLEKYCREILDIYNDIINQS